MDEVPTSFYLTPLPPLIRTPFRRERLPACERVWPCSCVVMAVMMLMRMRNGGQANKSASDIPPPLPCSQDQQLGTARGDRDGAHGRYIIRKSSGTEIASLGCPWSMLLSLLQYLPQSSCQGTMYHEVARSLPAP